MSAYVPPTDPATRPWTCWWWPIGFDVQHDIPVPASRSFDDPAEAIQWGRQMAEGGADWAKVFATVDEYHTIWLSSDA